MNVIDIDDDNSCEPNRRYERIYTNNLNYQTE